MLTIIVKDGKPKGTTRTSTDEQIKHYWGTTSFKSEEDRDKCAFIERKLKKAYNADDSQVIAAAINQVR